MKGLALVKSFLADHNTDFRRLFNTSTDHRRVALRSKLIRLLHGEGLNNSEISRVLDIDIGTVSYWLNEKVRQRKIVARRVRHDCSKLYGWWETCAQVLEARA